MATKKKTQKKAKRPAQGLTLQAEVVLTSSAEEWRQRELRKKRARMLRWCAAPFLFVGYKLWETLRGVGFVVAWGGTAFGLVFSTFYFIGFVIQLLLPADVTMAILEVTAKDEQPCLFCFFPSSLQIAALGIQSMAALMLLLLLFIATRSAFKYWFPNNWAKVKKRLDLE